MSTYQPSPIKLRRTRSQVEQLDQQIIAVLNEHHPQSVRHIFYRMTDPRLPEPVKKTDQGYKQVQERLVKLRRNGQVPYSWIADSSRRGYFVDTFGGTADFLRRVAGLYRADLWRMASHYVEVWVESRSLASVIQADCEELAVSLFPSGGFSSITLAYESAQQINYVVERTGKSPVVLYFGDYDSAGVLIDVKIQEELNRHLACEFEFIRLGITPEQIEQYDLPTKPRKATDKRAKHIDRTVEGEAMPAHIMRNLLRQAVESYLPEGALAAAKVAEQSEREGLLALAWESESEAH